MFFCVKLMLPTVKCEHISQKVNHVSDKNLLVCHTQGELSYPVYIMMIQYIMHPMYCIPWAGPAVEAGIDAGATAQHPRPGIDDTIGGDEGLRRWVRRHIHQPNVEVLHVWDVAVAVRGASPLQQQHLVLERQRRRQWAAGSAPTNDDVVVCRRAPRGVAAGLADRREVLQGELLLACNDRWLHSCVKALTETRSTFCCMFFSFILSLSLEFGRTSFFIWLSLRALSTWLWHCTPAGWHIRCISFYILVYCYFFLTLTLFNQYI